jgi:spore maturation protein CgeB
MGELRLKLSEGMRKILSYPRFAGPTRMLILDTNYFFDKTWQRAAGELGWEVATVPSAITGTLSRADIEQLFTAIGGFKPDFILTSNYAGMDIAGMFARFFEDARIPYVSWFTDTPRMILFNRAVHTSHYSVAATWERGYIKHLEALGFEHVYYMPHAIDPELFNGEPTDAFDRDLAFVGISMIALARDAFEKLNAAAPQVREAIDRDMTEGRITRATFVDGVEAILDPALLEQCTTTDRRNVTLYAHYELTRRQRHDLVTRMASFGIEVRGDPDWLQVTPNVGGGVGYFDDLAPFYRRTAVNLNSTSLQMMSAVNQRVFDCPAAGGFLITDAQSDLEELFDLDSEVVTYRDLDELADKVAYYLKHPDERKAIVRRAQRRIAAHHTHRNRLESLDTYLRERFEGE